MPTISFPDFLAERLGTRHWVLAPRLTTRLINKSYDLAVPRKKYSALAAEWNAARHLDRVRRIAAHLWTDPTEEQVRALLAALQAEPDNS